MGRESKKDADLNVIIHDTPSTKYAANIEDLLRGKTSRVYTLVKKNKLNSTVEYVCDVDGTYQGEKGWAFCRYTDKAFEKEENPYRSSVYIPQLWLN